MHLLWLRFLKLMYSIEAFPWSTNMTQELSVGRRNSESVGIASALRVNDSTFVSKVTRHARVISWPQSSFWSTRDLFCDTVCHPRGIWFQIRRLANQVCNQARDSTGTCRLPWSGEPAMQGSYSDRSENHQDSDNFFNLKLRNLIRIPKWPPWWNYYFWSWVFLF